jgi:acyl-CoA synthetase (AMP-forming)/AMP-acid ligase II
MSRGGMRTGLVSIVDRKKDVIIRSGFNVYPREVEDVLFEHPAVQQAAVVGIPHEKWGEEVRAVVVLREWTCGQASASSSSSSRLARAASLRPPRSSSATPFR